MTFEHLVSSAVAMECKACHKYAAQGMHRGTDGHWYHPECCPTCKPREPLAPGELASTSGGEQTSFFAPGESRAYNSDDARGATGAEDLFQGTGG